MGLRNAIITKLSNAQIRTTHVTGMVTEIGMELGKLAYRSRDKDVPDPVRADRQKLLGLRVLVLLFFVGGVLGALGLLRFGSRIVIPAALWLLLVSLPPLLLDLRGRPTP